MAAERAVAADLKMGRVTEVDLEVCHEGLRPTCRNRLNHQTSAKSQMDTKGETKGRSPWAEPDDED
uniref:Uncharacterized protein n=1 Tax=Oryza nivara TaxID=4536 RepID=A0A0E0GZS0_ORYNI